MCVALWLASLTVVLTVVARFAHSCGSFCAHKWLSSLKIAKLTHNQLYSRRIVLPPRDAVFDGVLMPDKYVFEHNWAESCGRMHSK